jgi:hypothetical protein
MSKRRKIAGQFVPYLREMLNSPAFRILSPSALRVLHRLEIEHLSHGGKSNGKLVVTFNQFVEHGLHRHAIAPAIRELVALGFIEITQQGRAGNAHGYQPSQYRLTYLPTAEAGPTHEWRQIADAKIIAQRARRARSIPAKNGGRRNRNPVAKTITGKPLSQWRKPSLVPVTVNALGPSDGNHHSFLENALHLLARGEAGQAGAEAGPAGEAAAANDQPVTADDDFSGTNSNQQNEDNDR